MLIHHFHGLVLTTLIQVGYIPIPRIEYSDDALDLVVENLTLQGRNIFPNIISMEAHNFVKFSPYNTISDEHHHEFTLHFGQVQADMRDVAFYFNKKSGFPKIKDSGLADVILGGNGLAVRVSVSKLVQCLIFCDFSGYCPSLIRREG